MTATIQMTPFQLTSTSSSRTEGDPEATGGEAWELRIAAPTADKRIATDDRYGDFWSRLTHAEASTRIAPEATSLDIARAGHSFAPEIEVPQAAKSAFTSELRRMVPILRAIVLSKSAQAQVPIERIRLDLEHDEEENSDQLVLVMHTSVTGVQALAFWNSLDVELDRWLMSIPERDRDMVTNRVGLRFAWRPG